MPSSPDDGQDAESHISEPSRTLNIMDDPDQYPDRPQNHAQPFPFHQLYTHLFDPLIDIRNKPSGSRVNRNKRGFQGVSGLSPFEARRSVIERFISRWRTEVGNDFYPAIRLILPEKDRERGMYGLKEKAIGKLLVKLLKITATSDDGSSLLNWKLPGQRFTSNSAGDFPSRCYEVLSKRARLDEPGDMHIDEVNDLLDQLSAAQKEVQQLSIFEKFYNRMNATEMMWLIRIILRQMKVGASERTFFDVWHPDGEKLFNVSSSLKRVCWELTDPSIRLEGDESSVTVMQCFQPQLAQFQQKSFQTMVNNMRPEENDNIFWIEEKLDGERMQLHMTEDPTVPGGMRFAFWSRKAKEYTHLYGNGFEDDTSALTRHIKEAFDPQVRNLILDGEMITWDPQLDIMVPFGSLKTAALLEQKNPFDGTGMRPLYRVFDCLYINDKDITQYTLRDRRRGLQRWVKNVHRRIEVHEYVEATTAAEIEPLLRQVVAEASEGLVLKNPRSMYRLNSRNDDWMKVKPDYMTEFGESLDCIIIGGYFGQGRRGGGLASFLCGLRVDQNQVDKGANPMKCYSFFKVGGGFKAEDYATVRHHTEGKWLDWDRQRPPTDYIELGGDDRQFERPDQWIKPCDSVVVEVKAASVSASESFRMGFTLRFPRFKRLRLDKDWKSALSMQEFIDLKGQVERESREKEFQVETRRKVSKRLKVETKIAGNDHLSAAYAGPKTETFRGLNFCVLSEMTQPRKQSKPELERLIKSQGGQLFQNPTAKADMICVGDKRVVKVASLIKTGATDIVRPAWILDALAQVAADGPARPRLLLPLEPAHMFHTAPQSADTIAAAVDAFGDSYARDLTVAGLRDLLEGMPDPPRPASPNPTPDLLLQELETHNHALGETPGSLFARCLVFLPDDDEDKQNKTHAHALDTYLLAQRVRFGGGELAALDEGADDPTLTHVVMSERASPETVRALRRRVVGSSARASMPRFVGRRWVADCWREGTRLDEERYALIG